MRIPQSSFRRVGGAATVGPAAGGGPGDDRKGLAGGGERPGHDEGSGVGSTHPRGVCHVRRCQHLPVVAAHRDRPHDRRAARVRGRVRSLRLTRAPALGPSRATEGARRRGCRLLIYCSGVISGDARPEMAALMPQPDRSVVAVPPPGTAPGTWAGAPSAACSNGDVYLAYRLRRPLGHGRGYAVAVARSADGVRFETLLTIGKEEMDAESLERPALVRTLDGAWRLYLSCATTGTKHWRVEVIEASSPDAFEARRSRVVLPGDAEKAVKDPVIVRHGGVWHLWASTHPLADPDQTDRMATESAALTAASSVPAAQSPAGGGLRYLSVLELGDGHERWYYELTRPDGAHELRTELR